MAGSNILSVEDIASLFDRFEYLPVYGVQLIDIPASPWSFSSLLFGAEREEFPKMITDFLKVTPKRAEVLEETENEVVIDFEDLRVKEAIERLNDCLVDKNLKHIRSLCEMDNLSEKEILVGIGVHLIKPLSGDAFTSKSREKLTCPCGCGGKLQSTEMCIGSEATWHGELDLLAGCKATNIAVTKSQQTDFEKLEEIDEETEFGTLPGNHTNSSVNCGQGLCQIAAQAIVFAWTEYNRHPDYSPYIPSVLVMNGKFMTVMYNPVKDTLYFAGGFIRLCPFQSDFEGIFCLWVFLNHRLFFRKRATGPETKQSGFNNIPCLDKYQALEEYQQAILLSKSVFNVHLETEVSYMSKKK